MIDWLDRWKQLKLKRRNGAQCQDCIYWEFRNYWQELSFLDGEEDDIWGQCHRHAPRANESVLSKIGNTLGTVAWAVEVTANIEHKEDARGIDGTDYEFATADEREVWEWPLTQPDAWCGEFREGRVPMSAEDRAYFEQERRKDKEE